MQSKIFVCSKKEILKKKYINIWVEQWKDEIIIFLDRKDKIKVFSSICPHFGGEIIFDEITNELKCKWHNWRFCVDTGKCLTHKIIGRLKSYDFEIKPGILKKYSAETVDNDIYAILQENNEQ